MSDKGFTDDEVREALARFKQDFKFPVMDFDPPIIAIESMFSTDFKALRWAASEYLKAKAVIEWYAEGSKGLVHSGMTFHGGAIYTDAYTADNGAKAREYIEKLNQNKGE